MLNIKDLIDQLQQATAGATISVNITINGDTPTPTEKVYDTDFEIGDRVLVCHVRNDGERVHTFGVIDDINTDDKGDYVRVTADNGKHYRTGLKYNQERLGSMIVRLDEDAED